MAKLYELAQEYKAVFEELEETEGEITPEIAEKLDRAGKNFDEKLEAAALYVLQLESDVKQLKEETARLQARAKTKQNRIEWLKNYILQQLEATGRNIETPRVSVRKMQSPPHVIIDDIYILPLAYKYGTLKLRWDRIPDDLRSSAELEVDKAAIRELYLKHGETVPGTKIECRPYVRIR